MRALIERMCDFNHSEVHHHDNGNSNDSAVYGSFWDWFHMVWHCGQDRDLQEVVFGASGQTLKICHDAIDRTCYMPGVLLAVKKVGGLKGLTNGLDELLGLKS